MKKFTFLAACAAMVLVSCNKEENLQPEMSYHTITASLETDSPETKAAFNLENGKMYWIKGDEIAVSNSNGEFTKYTLSNGANTPNATFTGTKVGDNSNYALHPFSESHRYQNSEVTFNLPESYTYTETSDDYGTAPLIAYTEDVDATSYSFKHLGGAFCFTIKNLPAGVNYFKFEADEKITGSFTVTEKEGMNIISLPAEDEASSVTIKFPAEGNATTKKFFIPLPVGEIDGFRISIGIDNDETWYYTSTKSNNITRRKVLVMPTVTLNATVDGVVPTEISTDEELIEAFEKGGKYVLSNDVTFTSMQTISNDLVLDLNENTIFFKIGTPDQWPCIKNTATTTIRNGKISSNDIGIQNNGTLTINCDIEAASSAINNIYGCTTTIEGGHYTSTSTQMSLIAVDGKWDSSQPNVIINDGTFESIFTNVSFNNGAKGAVNAGKFICTGGWHNIYVGGENGGCNVTYKPEECSFKTNGNASIIVVKGTNANKVNGIDYTETTVLMK